MPEGVKRTRLFQLSILHEILVRMRQQNHPVNHLDKEVVTVSVEKAKKDGAIVMEETEGTAIVKVDVNIPNSDVGSRYMTILRRRILMLLRLQSVRKMPQFHLALLAMGVLLTAMSSTAIQENCLKQQNMPTLMKPIN